MLNWHVPVSWRTTKHPGMIKQTIDEFCAKLSKLCGRGDVGAQWRAECNGGKRYKPSSAFEDIPFGLWENGLVFPLRSSEGEITDEVNYIDGNTAFTAYALAHPVDVQFRRSDVERKLKPKKPPRSHSLATKQERLATAIASHLDRGERPGDTIPWKEFCCSIRNDCNGWADPAPNGASTTRLSSASCKLIRINRTFRTFGPMSEICICCCAILSLPRREGHLRAPFTPRRPCLNYPLDFQKTSARACSVSPH
jgi:hypothetical protein